MNRLTAHITQIARLQVGKIASRSVVPVPLWGWAILPSAGQRPAAGFTLIELLVAITLIGIVSGIAIPGLFGIYQRQQLINVANEVVSAISTARASALANDQGQYAANLATDCDDVNPYVSAYEVNITDAQTYTLQRAYRAINSNGDPCISGDTAPVRSVELPGTVVFAGADVGKSVSFETVTGRMTPASLSLSISDSNLLSGSVIYYICTSAERIYAQDETC